MKQNLRFYVFFAFPRQKNGVPDEIRTHDLLLRRQPLYPTELRERFSSIKYHLHGLFSIGTLLFPLKVYTILLERVQLMDYLIENTILQYFQVIYEEYMDSCW